MTQSTLQEFEEDLGRDIERLAEGDAFRADCHDEQLTVHSDAEFNGAVALDVYDSDGRHLPIGNVDGTWYLGYSQTTPIQKQRENGRVKEITSINQPSDKTRCRCRCSFLIAGSGGVRILKLQQ